MISTFYQLITLDETHSTNQYLQELCHNEAPREGVVVSANFQTAGKGQRGNCWEAERDMNLLFSLLLRPTHLHPARQFVLSQLVSLAIVEVLSSYAKGFCVKWPNDIYWHDSKIAGILIENELYGSTIGQCVVGVGLNVNQVLFLSDAPNPVSLRQIVGVEVDREVLLHAVIERVLALYDAHSIGELSESDLAASYFEVLYRNKGYHRYESEGCVFEAAINGVEPDGHLVLATRKGEELRFAFKEVSFLF